MLTVSFEYRALRVHVPTVDNMIPSNYCHLICLLVLCSMRNADTAKTYMPNRNVVFILVDDLRPALKSFGDNKAFTPNIDSLADRSFVFRNVYAQVTLNQLNDLPI